MKPMLYIVAVLLFYACKQEVKEITVDQAEVEWEKVKDTTDHHALLVYLNKHPESKYFDTAISRYLNYYDRYLAENEVPISCCFDCKTIYVNDEKEIMFSSNIIPLDSVKIYTFNYFYIDDEYTFPSYKKFNDEYNKLYRSEIIRFNFNPLYPNNIQQCFIEVRKGIVQYRDSLINRWYNKGYYDLDSLSKVNINRIFDIRIRPEKHRPIPPPPPPPPTAPEVLNIVEEK